MEKELVEHEMEFSDSFRYNEDIKKKIKWLMKNDGNIESVSHLIRIAIIRLYNWEVENNVDKGITPDGD